MKVWDSLENNLERWCYLFGNLNTFAKIPDNPSGFDDVFDLARTGELNGKELETYGATMLHEYEKYVYGEYARQEGLKEGEAKQQAKIAKAMLADKVAPEVVANYTGLTTEEVEALRQN